MALAIEVYYFPKQLYEILMYVWLKRKDSDRHLANEKIYKLLNQAKFTNKIVRDLAKDINVYSSSAVSESNELVDGEQNN